MDTRSHLVEGLLELELYRERAGKDRDGNQEMG